MSLSRATLADRAYTELRDRILSGRLGGGRRLLPEELAVDLDISPTPIKEALIRLEADGLVESPLRKGAFVRRFTARVVEELCEARMMIEPPSLLNAFVSGGITGELVASLRTASLLVTGRHHAVYAACRARLPFVAMAALAGGNVRVGLEDNLYIAKGQFASNGQLVERAAQMSPYFIDAMFSLSDLPVVVDIRAIGMLAAVEVAADGTPGVRGHELQKRLFDAGINLKSTGDNLIVAPPFISEKSHVTFSAPTPEMFFCKYRLWSRSDR